jgi:hypothetical protein
LGERIANETQTFSKDLILALNKEGWVQRICAHFGTLSLGNLLVVLPSSAGASRDDGNRDVVVVMMTSAGGNAKLQSLTSYHN